MPLELTLQRVQPITGLIHILYHCGRVQKGKAITDLGGMCRMNACPDALREESFQSFVLESFYHNWNL